MEKKNKIINLKNDKKIKLRTIERMDLESIWGNFNEVIDEGMFLPTFDKVNTAYERRSWYEDLLDCNNICVVAEDIENKTPNNIIGQCTIESIQWEASTHVGILGIIIRKDYRNIGLGEKIVNHAIEIAKKNGKKKIILSTFDNNQAAILLYEKLGFQKVGCHKKHFLMNNVYIDEINMEKWIED
jgi:ribosomal protein S18 acetylase RimI-like enzyme